MIKVEGYDKNILLNAKKEVKQNDEQIVQTHSREKSKATASVKGNKSKVRSQYEKNLENHFETLLSSPNSADKLKSAQQVGIYTTL